MQRYTLDAFVGGPHFSLSLELGFSGQNSRAAKVLSALRAYPKVQGVWTEPAKVGHVEDQELSMDLGAKRGLYGLLSLDDIRSLPFCLFFIREVSSKPAQSSLISFGVQTEQPSDWMTLDIPVSTLEKIWSVDESWSVASQPWLSTLCRALADIANHVHAATPLLGGVMGEEASGCWRVPTPVRSREAVQDYPPLAILTAQAIEERGGFVITPQLWRKLKPNASATTLSSGLLYMPPHPSAPLTGA